MASSVKFSLSAVGGTFDRLHEGHKKLLREAFRRSKKVLVGISSDSFVKKSKKKHKELVQPFSLRKKNLRVWLWENDLLSRAKLFALNSIFDPGLLEKNSRIEAVFASEDVRKNALLINMERKKKRLPPISIVIVPLLKKRGRKVSSENSRAEAFSGRLRRGARISAA